MSKIIGKYVQLETIKESHRALLRDIAQDERIWVYAPAKAYGDGFDSWFDKALSRSEKAEQSVFVVRRCSDQQILGSTRYYHISRQDRKLSIGYTWYIVEAWGSIVNLETKYLLLQNAFENLKNIRVEFMIDSRNARSIAAIQKIGAKHEGVLRQHMILEDGIIRDTAVFSIIESEWPEIKLQLEARINEYEKIS